MTTSHKLWAVVLVVLAAAPLPLAQAGLTKDVTLGLSLFDWRFTGERNLLGDGLTINGAAVYSNRRFDFGLSDLTLTGALRGSAGYTLRGIPALNFSLNSGGAPLAYTFNINNGIQDLTATGNELINIDTHVNALGFYDQTIQISNRGHFSIAGFVDVDSGTTDYDVGPIVIHGNVFADALATVTEPIFAATGTENPFSKFTGRAAKAADLSKQADELRARIAAGEILSDKEIATLVNNTVLAAVLGTQPSDHLFDSLMIPNLKLDASTLRTINPAVDLVPEPGTALLLAMSLLVVARRRPRSG